MERTKWNRTKPKRKLQGEWRIGDWNITEINRKCMKRKQSIKIKNAIRCDGKGRRKYALSNTFTNDRLYSALFMDMLLYGLIYEAIWIDGIYSLSSVIHWNSLPIDWLQLWQQRSSNGNSSSSSLFRFLYTDNILHHI